MRHTNKSKFLLGLLFFSTLASAAVVSRVTSFSDGEVLFASDLNSEFNNLISGINSINDDQIADNAAIDPAKLSATIAGDGLTRDGTTGVLAVSPDGVGIEIVSDDVSLKDDGVTNAKLADATALSVKGNGTNASANPTDITAGTDGHVLRRSGTTVGFGTVAAAGLASGSVTWAKRETRAFSATAVAGVVGRSAALTSQNLTSSYADLTNLTLTLTTTGSPVVLQLIASDDGGGFNCSNTSQESIILLVKFVRDSTDLPVLVVSAAEIGSGTSNLRQDWAPSSFGIIDFPSAGTYTYKVQATESNVVGNTCSAADMRLVAYEL